MVNQGHWQALSNFRETYLMRGQVRKGQLGGSAEPGAREGAFPQDDFAGHRDNVSEPSPTAQDAGAR